MAENNQFQYVLQAIFKMDTASKTKLIEDIGTLDKEIKAKLQSTKIQISFNSSETLNRIKRLKAQVKDDLQVKIGVVGMTELSALKTELSNIKALVTSINKEIAKMGKVMPTQPSTNVNTRRRMVNGIERLSKEDIANLSPTELKRFNARNRQLAVVSNQLEKQKEYMRSLKIKQAMLDKKAEEQAQMIVERAEQRNKRYVNADQRRVKGDQLNDAKNSSRYKRLGVYDSATELQALKIEEARKKFEARARREGMSIPDQWKEIDQMVERYKQLSKTSGRAFSSSFSIFDKETGKNFNAGTFNFQNGEAINKLDHSFSKLGKTMFRNMIFYQAISGAFYAMAGGIGTAIQSLTDFERQWVKVSVLAKNNGNSVNDLRQTTMDLAVQYGTDPTLVAKTVSDTMRYKSLTGGKQENIKSLAESAMIAGNISGIDQNEATELLISNLKQYKLNPFEKGTDGRTNLKRLLDSWTYTAYNSSADVEDIAKGMTEVGALAAQNGSDPEFMSSALATYISATGDSGTVAGKAMNAWLKKMYTGEGTAALARQGITVSDGAGGTKKPEDLLREINAKWKTMSSGSKNQLAMGITEGKRASDLISFLNDADNALTLYNERIKAKNAAEKENARVMKTLSGQWMILKASTGVLVQNLGRSGLLSVLLLLVKGMNGLLKGFNDFLDFVDQLPPSIKAVTEALLGLVGAIAIFKATKFAMGFSGDVMNHMAGRPTSYQIAQQAEQQLTQAPIKRQRTSILEMGVLKNVDPRVAKVYRKNTRPISPNGGAINWDKLTGEEVMWYAQQANDAGYDFVPNGDKQRFEARRQKRYGRLLNPIQQREKTIDDRVGRAEANMARKKAIEEAKNSTYMWTRFKGYAQEAIPFTGQGIVSKGAGAGAEKIGKGIGGALSSLKSVFSPANIVAMVASLGEMVIVIGAITLAVSALTSVWTNWRKLNDATYFTDEWNSLDITAKKISDVTEEYKKLGEEKGKVGFFKGLYDDYMQGNALESIGGKRHYEVPQTYNYVPINLAPLEKSISNPAYKNMDAWDKLQYRNKNIGEWDVLNPNGKMINGSVYHKEYVDLSNIAKAKKEIALIDEKNSNNGNTLEQVKAIQAAESGIPQLKWSYDTLAKSTKDQLDIYDKLINSEKSYFEILQNRYAYSKDSVEGQNAQLKALSSQQSAVATTYGFVQSRLAQVQGNYSKLNKAIQKQVDTYGIDQVADWKLQYENSTPEERQNLTSGTPQEGGQFFKQYDDYVKAQEYVTELMNKQNELAVQLSSLQKEKLDIILQKPKYKLAYDAVQDRIKQQYENQKTIKDVKADMVSQPYISKLKSSILGNEATPAKDANEAAQSRRDTAMNTAIAIQKALVTYKDDNAKLQQAVKEAQAQTEKDLFKISIIDPFGKTVDDFGGFVDTFGDSIQNILKNMGIDTYTDTSKLGPVGEQLAQKRIDSLPSVTSNFDWYYQNSKQIKKDEFDKENFNYQDSLQKVAKATGLDPRVIDAFALRESTRQHYKNGKVKLGPKTKYGQAVGLMQLLPSTAKKLGVDPKDPFENMYGGAKYIAQLWKSYGSLELAAAAYNGGPNAVKKDAKYGYQYLNPAYKGWAKETVPYVQFIKDHLKGSGLINEINPNDQMLKMQYYDPTTDKQTQVEASYTALLNGIMKVATDGGSLMEDYQNKVKGLGDRAKSSGWSGLTPKYLEERGQLISSTIEPVYEQLGLNKRQLSFYKNVVKSSSLDVNQKKALQEQIKLLEKSNVSLEAFAKELKKAELNSPIYNYSVAQKENQSFLTRLAKSSSGSPQWYKEIMDYKPYYDQYMNDQNKIDLRQWAFDTFGEKGNADYASLNKLKAGKMYTDLGLNANNEKAILDVVQSIGKGSAGYYAGITDLQSSYDKKLTTDKKLEQTRWYWDRYNGADYGQVRKLSSIQFDEDQTRLVGKLRSVTDELGNVEVGSKDYYLVLKDLVELKTQQKNIDEQNLETAKQYFSLTGGGFSNLVSLTSGKETKDSDLRNTQISEAEKVLGKQVTGTQDYYSALRYLVELKKEQKQLDEDILQTARDYFELTNQGAGELISKQAQKNSKDDSDRIAKLKAVTKELAKATDGTEEYYVALSELNRVANEQQQVLGGKKTSLQEAFVNGAISLKEFITQLNELDKVDAVQRLRQQIVQLRDDISSSVSGSVNGAISGLLTGQTDALTNFRKSIKESLAGAVSSQITFGLMNGPLKPIMDSLLSNISSSLGLDTTGIITNPSDYFASKVQQSADYFYAKMTGQNPSDPTSNALATASDAIQTVATGQEGIGQNISDVINTVVTLIPSLKDVFGDLFKTTGADLGIFNSPSGFKINPFLYNGQIGQSWTQTGSLGYTGNPNPTIGNFIDSGTTYPSQTVSAQLPEVSVQVNFNSDVYGDVSSIKDQIVTAVQDAIDKAQRRNSLATTGKSYY